MMKFRIYIKIASVLGQVSVSIFLVLSLFKMFYKFFICSQKFFKIFIIDCLNTLLNAKISKSKTFKVALTHPIHDNLSWS